MSESSTEKRPYKISNEDQTVKKGIAAGNMKELISKGLDKLGLPATSVVTLFLEDDTEVDDRDYFKTLPDNTNFIFKIKSAGPKTKKEKKKDKSPLLPTPLMNINTQEIQQSYYGFGMQQDVFGYQQGSAQAKKIPMKAHKNMFTLTFTTDTLIDLGRIEAEFRRFGQVSAASDYKRIVGRARVFVNFMRAEHAYMALQELGHCFYDLQISKHCLREEVKNQPFTEAVEETDMELFVGNIPKNLGPKKLRNVFRNYNVNFREYKEKKNHCYVQMFNMNDMMGAIKELNGQTVDNNKLVVRLKEVQKLIHDDPKKKGQMKKEKNVKEKTVKTEKDKERESTRKEKEIEKNQQKIQEYLQSGVKKEANDTIKCSLCEGTCRRAIKMRCCGVRACRGCAVLKVTKTRECWMWECSRKISSEDIMNDEELRQKISNLYKEKVENKDETKVPCP